MIAGTLPLVPHQHWFFEQQLVEPDSFVMSSLLRLAQLPTGDRLRRLADRLLDRHDILRMTFRTDGDGPTGRLGDRPDAEDLLRPTATAAPGEQLPAAAARLADSLSQGFSLGRAPLLALQPLRHPDGAALVVVGHHLVLDAWSLDLLHAEIDDVLSGRAGPATPAPRIADWTARLSAYAGSRSLRDSRDFWRRQAGGGRPVTPPWVPAADGYGHRFELDRPGTALVTAAARTARAPFGDLLLALVLHCSGGAGGIRDTGPDGPGDAVDIIDFGRVTPFPECALEDALGWYSVRYPVRPGRTAGGTPADTVAAVRQVLRSVPDSGLGYGVLRYLSGADLRRELSGWSPMSFNYLGRRDTRTAAGGAVTDIRPVPLPPRPHFRFPPVLAVNAAVQDGCLIVVLRGPRDRLDEDLAGRFEHRFRTLCGDL